VLSNVLEAEVTTENPPWIDECPNPPSSIRLESNVAMNVTRIGTSDVNAAEIANRMTDPANRDTNRLLSPSESPSKWPRTHLR
jgi:hypothetical protein